MSQDPRWSAETERQLVTRAIHRASCYDSWEECWVEGKHRRAVHEVLTALAEAGLLVVPPDTTARDEARRRGRILSLVSDTVADLLYYDRKEDSTVPVGAIDAAVAAGEITVDEITAAFRAALIEGSGT
ncbi:MAG: hypothetical protein V4510_12055 [bacterium]